jgi:NAD(P)-dependent dehydrogenase (short-subunit alcohol dehydrogenase family)
MPQSVVIQGATPSSPWSGFGPADFSADTVTGGAGFDAARRRSARYRPSMIAPAVMATRRCYQVPERLAGGVAHARRSCEMKKIRDRVAVVTGAASGIGRATAVLLAEKGAELALVDVNEAGLEDTRSMVEATGRRASLHRVDVSKPSEMEALAGAVEREHGRAEILVNNAGVSVGARFEDHSLEDFEWLMGINFWGVIYGCKFFLPIMRRADEAHIVNVSSVFGFVGVPMNSSYCASKFAVRGFSESLRAELWDSPIGVSSVHPGGVATNIVKTSRFVEPDGKQGMHARAVQAFERMLPPEKAAARIVRGIEKNWARILITREAYLIDAVKRLFPVFSSEVVGRRWKSFDF